MTDQEWEEEMTTGVAARLWRTDKLGVICEALRHLRPSFRKTKLLQAHAWRLLPDPISTQDTPHCDDLAEEIIKFYALTNERMYPPLLWATRTGMGSAATLGRRTPIVTGPSPELMVNGVRLSMERGDDAPLPTVWTTETYLSWIRNLADYKDNLLSQEMPDLSQVNSPQFWIRPIRPTRYEIILPTPGKPAPSRDMEKKLCRLIRDLIPPPGSGTPMWGPYGIRDMLTWENGVVPKMADAIAAEDDWEALPILADMIEDGYGNGLPELPGSLPHVLAHCRGPGTHYAGCWVTDLLSGRF